MTFVTNEPPIQRELPEMTEERETQIAKVRAAGDSADLWIAAIRVADEQLRRMRSVPCESLRQESYVAAGEALRTWCSEKGSLDLYVATAVRNAVYAFERRERRGGLTGSRKAGIVSPTSENTPQGDELLGDTLTYAEPPEGYGDPSDEAFKLQFAERLEAAKQQLLPAERYAWQYLGIDTAEEFAMRAGITNGAARRLREAVGYKLLAIMKESC
jgi:hypothetical protein